MISTAGLLILAPGGFPAACDQNPAVPVGDSGEAANVILVVPKGKHLSRPASGALGPGVAETVITTSSDLPD